MEKTRVLFLCTGNSARSQMAEALLRKHAGERFEVFSAGLEPKGINPYTIRVMNEVGLDVSGQWSKGISEYLGKQTFGYVITVCSNAEQNCPYFPGVTTRLHWPFDDPAACSGSPDDCLAQFRAVRDQIEAKIRAWVAETEGSMDPRPTA
jgi:arsenate reductase (thioredoxin)